GSDCELEMEFAAGAGIDLDLLGLRSKAVGGCGGLVNSRRNGAEEKRAVVVADRLLLPFGCGGAEDNLCSLHGAMLRVVDDSAHTAVNGGERRNGGKKNERKRNPPRRTHRAE